MGWARLSGCLVLSLPGKDSRVTLKVSFKVHPKNPRPKGSFLL